jgi:creatinine amidohydrolase
MSAGLFVENLSWTEAEAAHARFPTVVVPIGARAKEHGLHLPVNNDYAMAEALARRVAERAGVLIYPTLPYGHYPAFTEYPGSVSLRLETFRDTVIDVARSLARHGAKRVYFLNTGISTCYSLEPARLELLGEGLVTEYTDLRVAGAEERGRVREQEHGTHADEIETSMMLELAPGTVKLELAKKDANPPARGGLTRDPAKGRGVFSPTGAWGDPTLASAEKGRRLVEALVDAILAEIAALGVPGFVPAPPRTQYL